MRRMTQLLLPWSTASASLGHSPSKSLQTSSSLVCVPLLQPYASLVSPDTSYPQAQDSTTFSKPMAKTASRRAIANLRSRTSTSSPAHTSSVCRLSVRRSNSAWMELASLTSPTILMDSPAQSRSGARNEGGGTHAEIGEEDHDPYRARSTPCTMKSQPYLFLTERVHTNEMKGNRLVTKV